MWPNQDLNPGSLAYSVSTLTTELQSHMVSVLQFPPAYGERVSVATERLTGKGQTKEDRNSNYIKQTSYGHSEKFDERE